MRTFSQIALMWCQYLLDHMCSIFWTSDLHYRVGALKLRHICVFYQGQSFVVHEIASDQLQRLVEYQTPADELNQESQIISASASLISQPAEEPISEQTNNEPAI